MSRVTGRAPTRIIEVAQDGKQIWAELLSPAERLTTNCCTRLFDNERDQRQRSDTIKPPPTQNSRGRESDDQHDREITADNRFDGVCAQRTRVQSRGNFQFVSRKNGHHDLGNDTNQNAPDTFMGVKIGRASCRERVSMAMVDAKG